MSAGPFRDPASADQPVPPEPRRVDWSSVVRFIVLGALAAFPVALECSWGRWWSALFGTLVAFGVPLSLVATHRLFYTRIERWQARRNAREVARLLAGK